MEKYKKWDWEYFKSTRSKESFMWFALNYKNKVSEDEFITAMKELKQYSNSKWKRTKYKPYSLKREYKYIVERFGFFTGEL